MRHGKRQRIKRYNEHILARQPRMSSAFGHRRLGRHDRQKGRRVIRHGAGTAICSNGGHVPQARRTRVHKALYEHMNNARRAAAIKVIDCTGTCHDRAKWTVTMVIASQVMQFTIICCDLSFRCGLVGGSVRQGRKVSF